MKTILTIALFLSSLFSQAQIRSAHVTAAGLTCAMCTKAIYSALQKLPGVASVEADIRNSGFVITFAPGASVDPDVLKGAVEDAGFSVARFTLTGNFSNTEVVADTHLDISGNTYHFLKVPATKLDGTRTLVLVDKSYIPAREFKKFQASTNHPCVETGKAEACCAKAGAAQHARIYHVTF